MFMNLCVFLGFNMLLPTLPLFLEGAGLAKQDIGVVFGTFTVSAVAARLLADRISGILGILMAARLGLFVQAAGTLAFILHESMASYMGARLLQGAGVGLTSTLMLSLASRTMPPSRLGEGIGYLGLGAPVAMAIGPYSGLYLAQTFGYAGMFVAVAACAMSAGLVSLMLPKVLFPAAEQGAGEKGGNGQEKGDIGQEKGLNWLEKEEKWAAFEPKGREEEESGLEKPENGQEKLKKGEEKPDEASAREPSRTASSRSAASAPGTALPRPSRIERAALPPALLMLVYGAAVASINSFLAVYASERNMPSVAEFFMVMTLGTVSSRLVAGKIFDRRGHLYVIPPAAALVALTYASLLSVPGRALMDVSAVLYGLGAGAMFPSLQTLAMTSVPPERRTTASAYFFVAFDIGIGAGSVFMGGLAEFFRSYRPIYAASIILMALFLASYFILFRPGGRAGGPEGGLTGGTGPKAG
jgi:MFS family permease